MRMMRWAALGSLLTVTGLTGPAALSKPAAPPLPALLDVSETDMGSTEESGCQYSFRAGPRTLVFMIGHAFMVRTGSGLKVCKVGDAQFGQIGAGKSGLTCAGARLSVRRTGRTASHMESDSSDGPAALTISNGRQSRVIAGRWGVAC